MSTIPVELTLRDGNTLAFTVDGAREGLPSADNLRWWIVDKVEEIDEKLVEDICFPEISIEKLDAAEVRASVFKVTTKEAFESYLESLQNSSGWATFETRNSDSLAALRALYGEPKMAVPKTRMLQRGLDPDYRKPVFEQEYGRLSATVTVRFQKPE